MKELFFISLTVLLFSCTQNSSAQNKLDAAQTEKTLQSDSSIQLIDLRTPGELAQTGVIPGAQNINYNSPDFDQQIAALDKSKSVLIYCASGGRSAKALDKMTGMGFKKVFEYTGGMSDWLAKGKKTAPAQ